MKQTTYLATLPDPRASVQELRTGLNAGIPRLAGDAVRPTPYRLKPVPGYPLLSVTVLPPSRHIERRVRQPRRYRDVPRRSASRTRRRIPQVRRPVRPRQGVFLHSPDVLPCMRHHSGTKNTAAGLNMVTLRANQEFVLAGQDNEPLILSQMVVNWRTHTRSRGDFEHRPSTGRVGPTNLRAERTIAGSMRSVSRLRAATSRRSIKQRTGIDKVGGHIHVQKNSLPIILFAGKCRQSASKVCANSMKPGAQAAVPYRAYRALVPSAGLLRIVRLVRTFFQTAGMDIEGQDGQIITREFDHLDKTKDLAGIGKSQKVLSTVTGVGVAEVVSWFGTKPACPSLNLGCEETQSDGAYFRPHRARGRTISLVGYRKVPSGGCPDRSHFSPWPGDGAPPLLSRRVGRPARRTEALAGTRSTRYA
jgi:hypothetical protein